MNGIQNGYSSSEKHKSSHKSSSKDKHRDKDRDHKSSKHSSSRLVFEKLLYIVLLSSAKYVILPFCTLLFVEIRIRTDIQVVKLITAVPTSPQAKTRNAATKKGVRSPVKIRSGVTKIRNVVKKTRSVVTETSIAMTKINTGTKTRVTVIKTSTEVAMVRRNHLLKIRRRTESTRVHPQKNTNLKTGIRSERKTVKTRVIKINIGVIKINTQVLKTNTG